MGHLIQTKVTAGRWEGIKCAKTCPAITHLFFADDLLLFSEASMDQIEAMESFLTEFYGISGQRISLNKSCICFPKNVNPAVA